MRFFKIILITVVTLFTIFIITYNARVSVINNLLKEQLSLYPIEINCLDISLASNMAIIVDKLCLQSAKADIEIVDMALQWQYLPKFKITSIDVKRANFKGSEHLFSYVSPIPVDNKLRNDPRNNDQSLNQLLPSILQPYIKQIKEFQLPIKIKVAEIYYLPFTVENPPKKAKTSRLSKQETPYIASLSAVDDTFSFSLKNADKIAFFNAELNRNKNKSTAAFSIALSSEFNLLKTFINEHQLPITAELQNRLNTNEISGRIDTVIKYQADSISMQGKISDLVIDSDRSTGSTEGFKLLAALNFESRLDLIANKATNTVKNQKLNKNNQEIALTFTGNNTVSLEYSQPNFFAILEKIHVSPAIISILEDNPLTQLTLKPKNKATLTLNNQQLRLSSIEMSASGNKRVHHVKLDNIMLDFANDNVALNSPEKSEKSSIKVVNALTIESFVIDSQLKLSSIATFTAVPVVIHLEGSLQKVEKEIKLNLSENSLITARNISLAKQQSHSTAGTVAAKNKVLIKLQTLTAQLYGDLQLMADNALSVNLKAHSQASQVKIPKKLQIDSFDFFSDIKGSLDNIHIKTTANADGINLGSIIIFGPIRMPKVEIEANKLLLTDLLSLKIQLPTKIALIDGTVDYSVSGQLINLNKLDKNLFSVSVVLKAVSGDVDGIWLQDLNWQQNFTLFEGKVISLPSITENLTVALIETPTPISNISVNTNWSFNKKFKLSANKLKADVLGGSFSVPKIEWPFENGHSVNVQLNSIDLEQLVALDKKQGIVVTGNISGQIPVTFDGEKYIIENGELYNISNGLIQVRDNPAVAELKANNSQLQLAFEALQNLHYHQLSSAVSMADDGYMLLETVIKGRNPDINNDVNLNLNLSYDLLGLLESLSITQRFEEGIIKGLQKNKE